MKPFLAVIITALHVASSFQPQSLSPRVGSVGTNYALRLSVHSPILARKSKSSGSNTHCNAPTSFQCQKKDDKFHLFSSADDDDESYDKNTTKVSFVSPVIFGSIAFLYWYLLGKQNLQMNTTHVYLSLCLFMFIISLIDDYVLFPNIVFGAAADANGLPVPAFIPMIPGWPPSDQDLVPVIEDSIHFFYISDILNSMSGDQANELEQNLPQLRLAFFNFAEAWVFAFLPLLLADKNRLPLPVVLGTWFGALGLTNAFLTPYLTARQLSLIFRGDDDSIDTTTDIQQSGNKALKLLIGLIASLVVGYAGYETIVTTMATPSEWNEFLSLVKNDRTYLAFAVDLVLFGFIQSFLLERITGSNHASDKIPFVGLISWLLR